MADINDIRYRNVIQNAQLKTQLESKTQNSKTSGNNFSDLLNQKLDKIKFSKHATTRMEERGISVDSDLMNKMNDAINKAHLKGVRDMVVLSDEKAFIVNVPSKVVVTTMNESEMKDNIFTNIDGAVII